MFYRCRKLYLLFVTLFAVVASPAWAQFGADVWLSFSPNTISPGQSTTLSWSSTSSVNSCRILFIPTNTNIDLPPNGSLILTPTEDLNPLIFCNGNLQINDRASLTIIGAAPAPTVNVSVNPSIVVIPPNTVGPFIFPINVSWTSSDATSCSAGGDNNAPASGSFDTFASFSTTYFVTCTGPGGSTTSSESVLFIQTFTPDAPTSLVEDSAKSLIDIKTSEFNSDPVIVEHALDALDILPDGQKTQVAILDLNNDGYEDSIVVNPIQETAYIVLSDNGQMQEISKTITGVSELKDIVNIEMNASGLIEVSIVTKQ